MFTAADLAQLTANPLPERPKPPAEPRLAYWRSYHQTRQATDPQYRAKKIAAAIKHKEKQRGQ